MSKPVANYLRKTDLKPIVVSQELKKDYFDIDVVIHIANNDFTSDDEFTVTETTTEIIVTQTALPKNETTIALCGRK